jgi:disulfide bond formation protein DsbB
MKAMSIRRTDAGTLIIALVFFASVASLATAFAGEYLFGLEPCILCLYERVPYGLAAVLAVCALVVPGTSGWRFGLLALAAAVFFAGAALALYHVGVEERWWRSVAACGGELATGLASEDLRTIGPGDLKPCDRVDWRLFGLSLAGYNVVASVLLAGLSLAGAGVLRRKA